MRSMAPPARVEIDRVVAVALHEDLGRGDLTTEACVPPHQLGRASLVCREPMVLSGLVVVEAVYAAVDAKVRVKCMASDGEQVRSGHAVAEIEGPAGAILSGERIALNFMQRMSGIATLTRRYVEARCSGSRVRITDTRKTTPGLRRLERYAVRCGGGHNHREDLGAAIMIKDNHIAAAGGITSAIELARARAPHTSRIECEIDSLSQLDEALLAGADILLFDNFDDDEIAAGIAQVAGRASIEVSGGMTLERVEALSSLAGLDAISVGALTHSARAMDIGLDWV